MYVLTNKRDHAPQIAKRYMRLTRARLAARLADDKLRKKDSSGSTQTSPCGKTRPPRRMRHVHLTTYEDPLGFDVGNMDVHYCISSIRRKPLDLSKDFGSKTDPAMKVSKILCLVIGQLFAGIYSKA
jgi:hypothetical protein